MAIEIKVPDIGADEVEITEILVKVGDKVEAEQSLITVEGDKASMEVPAPFAGTVTPTVQQTLHLLRQKRRKKQLRQQHQRLQRQKTLTFRISAATKLK